ncbi:hypothetical protein LAE98_10285 [Bacillus wiedmannii]|uniref:hypothetical protein n=1 Tax=Bacillus wiedmannii TaxID=1890302 RepID=UPI001CBB0439|nr:hypothetical protein [Bacillus wiedmannii]MBZ4222487.1 hypothetical protein [Bacillus wiedmannii]
MKGAKVIQKENTCVIEVDNELIDVLIHSLAIGCVHSHDLFSQWEAKKRGEDADFYLECWRLLDFVGTEICLKYKDDK